jgi:hypothetical protein
MNEKIATMKLNEIIELAVIAKEGIENEDWEEVGCRVDDMADELAIIVDWLEKVA